MIGGQLEPLLEKHLPQELVANLAGALASLQDEKLRIVNTGLLKAGKSTLFNCLTESLSDDLFAVGVTRKTIQSQQVEFEEFLLVDTPGIDCQEEDTKATVAALKQSDLIIFVHNMNTGELDMPEREFLESVAKECDSKRDFVRRMIFVLTNLDKKEGTGSEHIAAKIQQQLETIFGGKPNLVSVSSTRYAKGVLEKKALMVEKSGIPALKSVLYAKAAKIGEQVQGVRRKKAGKAYDAIDAHLLSLMDKARLDIKEAEVHIENSLKALDKDLSRFSRTIRTKLNHYSTL